MAELEPQLEEAPALMRRAAWPPGLLRAMIRLAQSDRWRGPALVVALAVGFTALVVMAELQAVLRGMHLPGASAFDAGAPSNFGFQLPSREHVGTVLNTWELHRQDAFGLGVTSPRWILTWFLAVDAFFLTPAYTLVLLVLIVRLRRGLPAVDERLGDDGARDRTYHRLLSSAFAAVPLLFLVDELENVTSWFLTLEMGEIRPKDPTLPWVLWGATWLKWILAGLIVLRIAIVAVAVAMREVQKRANLRTPSLTAWNAFVALRFHVLLLVFFAVILSTEQGIDVLRRWDGAWGHVLAGALLTFVFACVASASAWALLHDDEPRRTVVPLEVLAIAGGAFLVFGFALDQLFERGEGFWVLGVILLAAAVFSRLVRGFPGRPTSTLSGAGMTLPALVGAAPLVLLGLAIVRASTAEIFYSQHFAWAVLLFGLGIVLEASGWLFYARVSRRQSLGGALFWRGAVAAASVLAVVALLWPWGTGFFLGSTGILAGWTAVALVAWTGLAIGLGRLRTPPALAVFGLARIPIMALIVIWALLASAVDEGGYHNIRKRPAESRQPITLRVAFERWLEDQRLPEFRPDAPIARTTRAGGKTGTPLLLVAASGGGVRAAFWTATSLDCLLRQRGCSSEVDDFEESAMFAGSGISGGSLGLATYAAQQFEREDSDHWVRERFEDDQLGPTLAWTLFADLPNSLLRADLLRDRAAVLEESWERAWPDWDSGDPRGLSLGLFQLRDATDRNGRRAPLLLLNGTSVEDGCRFNTSILDAAVEARLADRLLEDCLALRPFEEIRGRPTPRERRDWALASTKDVNEFLCPKDRITANEDLRLSTAALLSARFPYVSPAARVVKCEQPKGESATYVVDGGYFDTSGASPLVELWQALEPLVVSYNMRTPGACVVPLFVQLDNGYHDIRGPDPNSRPDELMVPLKALRSARDAREANARQAAALAFAQRLFSSAGGSKPVWEGGVGLRFSRRDRRVLERFAHVYPRAHPGTRAPLGWSLSKRAMEDLEQQLDLRNAEEIARVHQWFAESNLRCHVDGV